MSQEQKDCNHQGYLMVVVFEIKDHIKPGSHLAPAGPVFLETAVARLIQCFRCGKTFEQKSDLAKAILGQVKPLNN